MLKLIIFISLILISPFIVQAENDLYDPINKDLYGILKNGKLLKSGIQNKKDAIKYIKKKKRREFFLRIPTGDQDKKYLILFKKNALGKLEEYKIPVKDLQLTISKIKKKKRKRAIRDYLVDFLWHRYNIDSPYLDFKSPSPSPFQLHSLTPLPPICQTPIITNLKTFSDDLISKICTPTEPPPNSCIQSYEDIEDLPDKEYLQNLESLQNYMKDTSKIASCKVMSSDSGINLTYIITYENGIKGILKYPNYEDIGSNGQMEKFQGEWDKDKVYREAGAFSVAKSLGYRSIAPIVATDYKSAKCANIKISSKVSISYFLDNSDHLKASNNHLAYYIEHAKHDWFNFLIFDCDHQFHNIMKKKDSKGKSYLFDHDWAFSNPKEVAQTVHTQPGYSNWCNKYIELIVMDPSTDPYIQERADALCTRYPVFKNNVVVRKKIDALAKGNFPDDFPPLSVARRDNLQNNAKNIMFLLNYCKN